MSSGRVHHVESDEEFEALLSTAEDKIVAVDFYADWCGPCKMISPRFESLSLEYPNIIFLKVNVEHLKGTSRKCGISAMPTFQFFKNGNKLTEFRGASVSQLESTLNQLNSGNILINSVPQNESAFQFFPQLEYIFFDAVKIEELSTKILPKIEEFNKEITDEKLKMNEREIVELKKSIEITQNTIKYHVTSFSNEQFHVIEKIVHWPSKYLFPVLDLTRLMILHPHAASYFSKTDLILLVLKHLTQSEDPWAVHMMSFRLISNSFRFEDLRTVLISYFDQIIVNSSNFLNHSNKNLKLAATTVFLNYSVLFHESPSSKKEKLVLPLLSQLEQESDEESQFRQVIALGTLMHGDQPFKQQLLSSKNVIESFKPLSEKTQKAKLELISILNRQEPSKQVPTPNSNQGTSGFGNLPSIPSMPSFGNMPNMPSFGNMSNGMSPELMQKIMSNPELMGSLQNPSLMAKLQAIMADPSKASLYANDPELRNLLQKFQGLM